MIEIKNISKSYGKLKVLNNINLQIESGKIHAIVGASGAGKTTLLQIIGTLDYPDTGEVIFDDIHVFKLKDKEVSAFRNKKIGFVFQFHHLLPEFTALENVLIPAMISGQKKKSVEEKAKKLLDRLGLSNRMDHKPNELSGGEQQRVAIARALINDPAVVLADEPSGNLDTANANELHRLFRSLCNEWGHTFIIVTHNAALAQMSDHVITIKDGQIDTEKKS